MPTEPCLFHAQVQADIHELKVAAGRLPVLEDRSEKAAEERGDLFKRVAALERAMEGINVRTSGLWGLAGTVVGGLIMLILGLVVAYVTQGKLP